MLRCCECNKRFVIDHGQLTYSTHQSQAVWNDFIVDTVHGNSFLHAASKIDVSASTSF